MNAIGLLQEIKVVKFQTLVLKLIIGVLNNSFTNCKALDTFQFNCFKFFSLRQIDVIVLVKLLAYFLINNGTSGFTSNTLLIENNHLN